MPNKSAGKSGFWHFMKDMQQELQAQGKNIPFKNMSAIASPKWEELPEDEKEEYNERAKQWKQKQKGSLSGKLDCTGAPIEKALKERKEDEDRKNKIRRDTKGCLKRLGSMEAVTKEKFYIMSNNIFCQTEEGIIVPAELAIVEYSILEGITKVFHVFTDPGELPTGYTYSCKQMSEDVHKIPIQNFEKASKNYMYIWNQIKLFVNPTRQDGQYPILYVMDHEMEQVEGTLTWLHRKSCDYMENPFEISNLAVLLLELRMFASEQGAPGFVNSSGLAHDILTRNVFDYVPNISCEWHEEQDVSNYCALGVVRRYAYLMSDYLCEVYDVEMIPERHVPLREDNDSISVLNPDIKVNVKPVVNRLDAPYKVTKHQFSDNLVTNFKSKYDTTEDKVIIPGSSTGVRSEIPASERDNMSRLPSSPWLAASVVKGAASDFQLLEDEFPSLSLDSSGPRQNLPNLDYAAVATPVGLGRGARATRGRGLRIPGAHQEMPDIPKQMQYVGIGRALTIGERNVQLGYASVTKPQGEM